ncbi:MAG: hypothetical protein J1E78_04200 [Muribaculaceae bacterium]|nr:hypothetical protein [Muribaculaceae bacterium]
MKKLISIACLSSLFILASCSGADKDRQEIDSMRIAELTANYEEAATFNDSLIVLMADIYNGLDSINMQEGLLYNMGNTETIDRRAEVRHNLAAIRERLAANHALLDQMEQKLKASNNKNAVLSKTIEQMKAHIEDQDNRIISLESQLAAANDSISGLNRRITAQEQQIEIQTEAKNAAFAAYEQADRELNTVYYALGTAKELKENGLLEKKFLGQTKVLKGDFNKEYFTEADRRTLTSINTGAKKIKIWSTVPAGSYTEQVNEDKTITLKITDPESFWSISPFLVIQLD